VLDTVGLLLVGLAAGALNAAGGGGTFVALPALVAVGLPPATANATTTVALLPGAMVSAWSYRHDVIQVGTAPTTILTMTSLVGGGLGAALLLILPSATFDAAVPWMLAFATMTLAFGRRVSRWLSDTLHRPIGMSAGAVLSAQFLLAVYGGYFGGAVGILMLALWSVGLGIDTAAGNPMRVTQLAAVWGTAAVFFLVAADVLDYPLPLIAVLVGAAAGGLAGAKLVRSLPARVLHRTVLTVAVTMTALYALG